MEKVSVQATLVLTANEVELILQAMEFVNLNSVNEFKKRKTLELYDSIIAGVKWRDVNGATI